MNLVFANPPPSTWVIGFGVLAGLVVLLAGLVVARKNDERTAREETRRKAEGSN
jgi:hypothetical protein